MLYSCGLCGKGYRNSKAHAQHLNSLSHIMHASQKTNNEEREKVIIKPLPCREVNKPTPKREVNNEESEESEESDDESEEIDPEEELVDEAAKSLTDLNVVSGGPDDDMEDEDKDEDEDDFEELDLSCCFMCDLHHNTIETSMIHVHKQHGFFIPDVEYLKDTEGLLTYVGLKVKRYFVCLCCNDWCRPFNSLEAVRKHMEAKRHCKVHYGDGDEEEAELEEFYGYSSSYMDEDGKQLVSSSNMGNSVELGGGSELIITKRTDKGTLTKTFGSREYLRYYCQKPRPTPANMAIIAAFASRYKSMGLASVQMRENLARMKVIKEMNRSGVEAMRTKIAMKSNIIRNLSKNVPY